jgi:hypothetical protein
MSIGLQTYLAHKYKTVATGYPDPTGLPTFRVDDESSSDVHHLFCVITVSVPNPENGTFRLRLFRCPHDERVQKLVQTLNGQYHDEVYRANFEVELSIKDRKHIRMLAKIIKDLVGPKQKYEDKHWVWVCRRTNASLKRFAEALAEFERLPKGKFSSALPVSHTGSPVAVGLEFSASIPSASQRRGRNNASLPSPSPDVDEGDLFAILESLQKEIQPGPSWKPAVPAIPPLKSADRQILPNEPAVVDDGRFRCRFCGAEYRRRGVGVHESQCNLNPNQKRWTRRKKHALVVAGGQGSPVEWPSTGHDNASNERTEDLPDEAGAADEFEDYQAWLEQVESDIPDDYSW